MTYTDLEQAPAVLLVGFEPEEESPMVFLRLRKGMRKRRVSVFSVAPFATRGLQKMGGALLATAPGTEPEVLAAIAADDEQVATVAAAVRRPGAIVLVGERAAAVAGTLTAVLDLCAKTGARLAWVPRRAGDRGALEAGLLPGLLPGGRPVEDPAARVDLATVWGASVPAGTGRDASAILAAARDGALGALVVGGVDPDDLPDPALALAALDQVPFLVSLEQRDSAVTRRADVVLPVAPVVEKAGTFLDWEGRERPFGQVLQDQRDARPAGALDARRRDGRPDRAARRGHGPPRAGRAGGLGRRARRGTGGQRQRAVGPRPRPGGAVHLVAAARPGHAAGR